MSAIYPDQDYQNTPATEVHETSGYTSASDLVLAFVEQQQVTTIGRISREFPQYREFLMSILNQLKVAGKVYWEDHKPMPTLVYAGDCKQDLRVDWSDRGH